MKKTNVILICILVLFCVPGMSFSMVVSDAYMRFQGHSFAILQGISLSLEEVLKMPEDFEYDSSTDLKDSNEDQGIYYSKLTISGCSDKIYNVCVQTEGNENGINQETYLINATGTDEVSLDLPSDNDGNTEKEQVITKTVVISFQ